MTPADITAALIQAEEIRRLERERIASFIMALAKQTRGSAAEVLLDVANRIRTNAIGGGS